MVLLSFRARNPIPTKYSTGRRGGGLQPSVVTVLVLFAHPAYERSRVNRYLVEAIADVPGIELRDLYELYPDFDVDVDTEQQALLRHDTIVFHHPLYWYSVPPLLKQWIDLVLEHGWAYGAKGDRLRGKTAFHAFTAGGDELAYRAGGYNRFAVRELTLAFEQTAFLCGMRYLPPFAVHGTHQMPPATAQAHAADYLRLLAALRDGQIDLGRAVSLTRLNEDLDALLVARATGGGS